MEIVNLKCINCGAPLKSANKVNNKIECEFCHTECVVDGLIKNQSILEKENINSGVSSKLSKEKISNVLVDALTETVAYPLDIFENGVVVKEKAICVSSYLFYCNGTASYTYDVGNTRQQQIQKGNKIKNKSYIEWTHMSGSANQSTNIIVSGNRQYAETINEIYSTYDVNKLEDVEELVFPADVENFNFNLPQPAVYGEFVQPKIEKMLESSAHQSLVGKTYKNLVMSGSNVQKGEVLRISLGIYKLTLQYAGEMYTIFVTGDGTKYLWGENNQPIDEQRFSLWNTMTEQEEKFSKKRYFLYLMIGCIIAMPVTAFLSIIPAGIFGYFWITNKKNLKEVQENIKKFIDEEEVLKETFIQSGAIINGIK